MPSPAALFVRHWCLVHLCLVSSFPCIISRPFLRLSSQFLLYPLVPYSVFSLLQFVPISRHFLILPLTSRMPKELVLFPLCIVHNLENT
ncbi:hypothetical protein BJ322DRAFT_314728 [Thelephora terrestris]|uniref:Uncharacterized protein n=1 Tax=Thelephora terrestris TaxID=56493 RepID=A0A9P6H6L4_9AGAM|nr:hypothetical protein BJ322DRAFT_314728 [Thelephora terrestris]